MLFFRKFPYINDFTPFLVISYIPYLYIIDPNNGVKSVTAEDYNFYTFVILLTSLGYRQTDASN